MNAWEKTQQWLCVLFIFGSCVYFMLMFIGALDAMLHQVIF